MTARMACDLHVGDVLHSNDWHMPIDAVDVEGRNVAVHVADTGYEFLLHYGTNEMVDIDPPGGAS